LVFAGVIFNGSPLGNYSDLTEKQRTFLEIAYVEYTNDNRKFLARLMGGEVADDPSGSSVRREGLRRLKHPDEVTKKT
jgi:hypothetical protein